MKASIPTETHGFTALGPTKRRKKPARTYLTVFVLACSFALAPFFVRSYEDALYLLAAFVTVTLLATLLVRTRSTASLEDFRAQLSALIDNPRLGLCIVEADGRISAINKTAVKIFGFPGARHARRLNFWDLPLAADVPVVQQFITAAFSGEKTPFRFRRTVGGSTRYFSSTVLPIRSTRESIRQLTILVEDVTEQQKSARQLRERERRHALTERGANVGLWEWDMERDTVSYSERWRSMLGYGPDHRFDVIDDWFRRVHPDDIDSLKAAIDAHLRGDEPQFESEHRMKMVDGGYRWVLSSGLAERKSGGTASRMAGSQTDIEARRIAEERLTHDALHDPLTGLPNRALFLDRLRRALRQQQEDNGGLFAVLHLDLDRFKVVNDSLGHSVGDHLLTAIAHRLGCCVRGNDTIARLDGDEFTLLLEGIENVHDATRTASRIHEQLSQPFHTDGIEIFTSASIGIATASPSHEKAEDVLRDADAAMNRAKSNGKARHEVFDAKMHSSALAILKLESELRRAFERNEFRLHYQPIVDLSTGRIGACEALIRWQHPERGLLSPGLFLHVVEDAGMMVELGEWVLRTACAQLAAWRQMGFDEIKVSINTSPQQYHRANLPELVGEVLDEHGLPPGHIFLELTEDQAMEDTDKTIATLDQLRALGVGISIDDFGTGYSSLSYLRRLPITVVKIAREFVVETTSSAEDATIAASILHLAHSLKLKVVAEGVESQDHLQYMIDHACDAVQGYVFFRPLPEEELTELLSNSFVCEIPKPNGENTVEARDDESGDHDAELTAPMLTNTAGDRWSDAPQIAVDTADFPSPRMKGKSVS